MCKSLFKNKQNKIVIMILFYLYIQCVFIYLFILSLESTPGDICTEKLYQGQAKKKNRDKKNRNKNKDKLKNRKTAVRSHVWH